jgi:hypothetical protein
MFMRESFALKVFNDFFNESWFLSTRVQHLNQSYVFVEPSRCEEEERKNKPGLVGLGRLLMTNQCHILYADLAEMLDLRTGQATESLRTDV